VRILTTVAILFAGVPAFAQVSVRVTAPPPPRIHVSAPPPPRIHVTVPPPPRIRFTAPPALVVVHPGVRVVADADQEVFFSAGCYWHRSPDGHWWRAHSYRGHWVSAPRAAVPVAVVRLPHGRYRHYHGGKRFAQHQRRVEKRRQMARRTEHPHAHHRG
jgi:hypothetical protein